MSRTVHYNLSYRRHKAADSLLGTDDTAPPKTSFDHYDEIFVWAVEKAATRLDYYQNVQQFIDVAVTHFIEVAFERVGNVDGDVSGWVSRIAGLCADVWYSRRGDTDASA